MNLFEKIQCIKEELLQANLKKSGNNKFAGYTYYELADFLPTIIAKCKEHKVFTYFTFAVDVAKLIAINVEAPEERVEIESPMKELQLKGCNDIQALGGVETYQRRYLYMALFDIVENDMFDAVESVPQKKPTRVDVIKQEILSVMGEIIKSGVNKDDVYAIIAKYNNGKKNPNSLKSEEACEKVLEQLIVTYKEKR